MGFGLCRGDDDTFAGGESVSLEDDGKAELTQKVGCLDEGFGSLEAGGRDCLQLHEAFGVNFASLQGRVGGGRTDYGHAAATEGVHNSGYERSFGPDYGQVDVEVLR